MHPIQKRLIELSQTHDLTALGLRQIARMIGEEHPQKIKHHMQQLGLLTPEPASKVSATQSRLVSLPILGLANCGEATIYADSLTDKFLQVSQRIIPEQSKNIFVVQAVGNSMNRANIGGNNIEDGDYVMVNPMDKDFKNGDYVLSIINGMANIKKFTKDNTNQQVILLSESTGNYSPIYIHEDDMAYFMASGKIVTVLKVPQSDYDDVVFTKV